MCAHMPRFELPFCRNTAQSLVKIAREEGARALWKGYVAKVVRLGPGGGIMLVVFDFASSFIRNRLGLH